MIRSVLAAIVTVALLFAAALAQAPLAGTSWRFVEVAGAAIPSDAGAALSFAQEQRASGSSGCNRFLGQYRSDGAALAFSNLAWTKMLCREEPKMKIEAALQSALAETRAYARAEGQLHLLGAGGAILARLEPSPSQ